MNPDELKQWLQANDVRHRELAASLGVSRSLVSLWVGGRREIPAWLDIVLASKALAKTLKKQK